RTRSKSDTPVKLPSILKKSSSYYPHRPPRTSTSDNEADKVGDGSERRLRHVRSSTGVLLPRVRDKEKEAGQMDERADAEDFKAVYRGGTGGKRRPKTAVSLPEIGKHRSKITADDDEASSSVMTSKESLVDSSRDTLVGSSESLDFGSVDSVYKEEPAMEKMGRGSTTHHQKASGKKKGIFS
ncbi:hypothetical protein HK102_004224, partial [Quaeritorhiza haematococci]